eukprot:Skav230529  [mRNA]  locus=scaffold1183:142721:145219:- [translate_table: standard]
MGPGLHYLHHVPWHLSTVEGTSHFFRAFLLRQAMGKKAASKSGDMSQQALDQRANEMNPNNRAFSGVRQSQAQQALNQRANAKNPNNRAFNGVPQSQEKKRLGRMEHELNLAASQTLEQKAARGRDVLKVVQAVREVLPQHQVHKVGSRAKGTQFATSDVDLKVMGPPQSPPLNREDKSRLGRALGRRFPEVTETQSIHKVADGDGLVWVVHVAGDVIPVRV